MQIKQNVYQLNLLPTHSSQALTHATESINSLSGQKLAKLDMRSQRERERENERAKQMSETQNVYVSRILIACHRTLLIHKVHNSFLFFSPLLIINKLLMLRVYRESKAVGSFLIGFHFDHLTFIKYDFASSKLSLKLR